MMPKSSSLSVVMALCCLSAQVCAASQMLLEQDFNDFDPEWSGVKGIEGDTGGEWRSFGNRESSPRATADEAAGNGGLSIRIQRDDAAVETADFWLIGRWAEDLYTGRVVLTFHVLRDTNDSGFTVHFGTDEKTLGQNTIAIMVSNSGSYGGKLAVMGTDGAWTPVELSIPVGVWAKVGLTMDFGAMTYSVQVDGQSAPESIPFEMNGPLRQVSFVPIHPDGNVSYIDDVSLAVPE